MIYSIRIDRNDLDALNNILFKHTPKENAAFLLIGKSTTNNIESFIVRRIIDIPDTDFNIRDGNHLQISTRAINAIISLCEVNHLGLALCHSHPKPLMSNYSVSDDIGEKRIANIFHSCLPNLPLISLLNSDQEYHARYWADNSEPKQIDYIKVVGRYIETIPLSSNTYKKHVVPELYDRQVLAFGESGQRRFMETKVGIIGVGGTGSAVAEQLVRLGVKDFILIDKDIFDVSNLTRIYGSYQNHTRSYFYNIFNRKRPSKVEIAKRNLYRINNSIKVLPLFSNVTTTNTCKALLDRDAIFLCTDDQWGRSVVNQLAYQYLIPTINIGVRIDSKAEKITGGTGALHILRPGNPCLWCYQYLKADIVANESLHLEERNKLIGEGYVKGLETNAPSVISLTSTIASMAVTMFLQLTTDFMGSNGNISALRHDILNGTINRCRSDSSSECICKKVKGFGDYKSLNTV
ncbi:MAG: ThiF family adenylyltransferase [Methylococcales bacterium]|nr:ThiF family adenylyltransferase [Methylococcales bacterium]